MDVGIDSAPIGASFRDPDGFVFASQGKLYRQINASYRDDFEYFMSCGLYRKLTDEKLLLPHQDASQNLALSANAYKVIHPQQLPFISYPYEWCFEQLKSAALLTLKIQKLALEHGMTLKDGSAFNVQFIGYRPIFIDSLSFSRLQEGQPWSGYKQFCEQFLAPIFLASYKDSRIRKLMLAYIDGIPLDLASKLLPWDSLMDFNCLVNIHLQSKLQAKAGWRKSGKPAGSQVLTKNLLMGIAQGLEDAIQKQKQVRKQAEWLGYYEHTNYSDEAMQNKLQIVDRILGELSPAMVWDLGANTGRFSALATKRGATTIAYDSDESCVSSIYQHACDTGNRKILPLILDLTNPTPSIGWQHHERMSFAERGPADCVLALAVIHHLLITGNVPMRKVAEFFASISRRLVIEFVPQDDSQSCRLLENFRHSTHKYDEALFRKEFAEFFDVEGCHPVAQSCRKIYVLRKR